VVIQATSSSASNVIWDPGTRQTLRITDYHTFASSGSDVLTVSTNATESTPPTFGGNGTPVQNGVFANVHGLNGTITTTSTDTLRLEGTLSVDNISLSYANLQVRFVVDSTATAGQTFWITPDAGPDTFRTIQFEVDVPNVAAGTHTIRVQAGTSSGAGVLYFDGGSATAPGGGGTVSFLQTLRITDYKTIPGSTPSGSSGWVSTSDVSANDSGALAATYTNVPGLTATFTLNATDTVRLAGSLNIFNSSTTAYGFPAVRFMIDGVTVTTGNSWNVNFVDSTGLDVEEELVFEDFISLGAGTHTVTVQAESTNGSVFFENVGSNQTLRVAAFQLVSGVTIHSQKGHSGHEGASALAILFESEHAATSATGLSADSIGTNLADLVSAGNALADSSVDSLFSAGGSQPSIIASRALKHSTELTAALLAAPISTTGWDTWKL
jgi:hypothetical protein